MATVDVNGTLIDFPDSLSPDQLQQAVAKAAGQISSPRESLLSKASDLLSLPEKKSREGLNMIAEAVSPDTQVTGNLPRDIAMNLPRIGAETLADTAPSFISKGAILTAGGLRGLKLASPLIKAAGSGLAKTGESISGMEYKNPGILKKIGSDPSFLFSNGKEAASPLYEAGKQVGGDMGPLAEIPDKKAMVKIAYKMAKDGTLNPTQALESRKELSNLKNSVTDGFFRKATAKFNEIAKPIFADADAMHAQGIQASEARRLLPVNKYGGTSVAKSILGSIGGILPTVAMSPLAQSGAAAAAGTAAKIISPLINNATKAGPVLAGITKTLTEDKARDLLREAKGDREKARELAKQRGYEIPE